MGHGAGMLKRKAGGPEPTSTTRAQRRSRGVLAALSGEMAEDSVARHLAAKGRTVLARRWRSAGGDWADLENRCGHVG